MRVLLIEDDQNKLKQLSNFINHEFTDIQLVKKSSYQSGLREIIEEKYDLIILDMSMPTFDISSNERGGRPRVFAGREILKQMKRRNNNCPVVIVTQFESFGDPDTKTSLSLNELRVQLSTEFANYLSTIYYNASVSNWKEELKKILQQIDDSL